jgi:hypothetical protein
MRMQETRGVRFADFASALDRRHPGRDGTCVGQRSFAHLVQQSASLSDSMTSAGHNVDNLDVYAIVTIRFSQGAYRLSRLSTYGTVCMHNRYDNT